MMFLSCSNAVDEYPPATVDVARGGVEGWGHPSNGSDCGMAPAAEPGTQRRQWATTTTMSGAIPSPHPPRRKRHHSMAGKETFLRGAAVAAATLVCLLQFTTFIGGSSSEAATASFDWAYYDELRNPNNTLSTFVARSENVDVYSVVSSALDTMADAIGDGIRGNITNNATTTNNKTTTAITTEEAGGPTIEEQELGLCHVVGLVAFSVLEEGKSLTSKGSDPYKDMVGALLAVQHFNTGNGSIVRDIEGINERCPVRFTTEFFDTEFTIFRALTDLTDVITRDRDDKAESVGPLPCTILGAERSAVTQPTSTLSSVHNLAQMSYWSSSPELDSAFQFPYFARVIPSDEASAFAAVRYLRGIGVKHVSVLYINDAFGQGYNIEFQKFGEMESAGNLTDVQSFPIPIAVDDATLRGILGRVKALGYRYIFAIIFSSTYDRVMTIAYEVGLVGGGHQWTFGGGGIHTYLQNATYVKDSPLEVASRGVGVIQEQGGLSGYYGYDAFVDAWQSLNDDDVTYFNSRVPNPPPVGWNGEPTPESFFQAPPGFFQRELPGPQTGFAYDTVITMGLAACNATAHKNPSLAVNSTSPSDKRQGISLEAENEHGRKMVSDASPPTFSNLTYFDGEEHYLSIIHDAAYEGVSGIANINETTRSRVPTTSFYVLWNSVPQPDEIDDENVTYDVRQSIAVVPSMEGTEWSVEVFHPFVYSNGKTSAPRDLPPLSVNMNYLGSVVILGAVLCAVILGASISFAAWTYYNREVRVIKASQPFFLEIICFGAALLVSTIIPFSIDDQHFSVEACNIACMAGPWLWSLGFITAFSALFAKTWRINRIFHHPHRFQRIKVTEWDVLPPFAVLAVINVTVLLCWTFLAPLKWKRDPVEGTDAFNRPMATVGRCMPSDGSIVPYVSILAVIDIGVVVFANFQAYQARNIHTEFSESRYIGLIMASLLQGWLLGIPLLFLVWNIPVASYVVKVFITFGLSSAILFFMFMPKLQHLRKFKEERRAKEEERERRRQRRKEELENGRRLSELGPSVLTTSSACDDGEEGLKIAVVNSAIISRGLNQTNLEQSMERGRRTSTDEGPGRPASG